MCQNCLERKEIMGISELEAKLGISEERDEYESDERP